jgi:hypothetical protein
VRSGSWGGGKGALHASTSPRPTNDLLSQVRPRPQAAAFSHAPLRMPERVPFRTLSPDPQTALPASFPTKTAAERRRWVRPLGNFLPFPILDASPSKQDRALDACQGKPGNHS